MPEKVPLNSTAGELKILPLEIFTIAEPVIEESATETPAEHTKLPALLVAFDVILGLFVESIEIELPDRLF